MASSSDENKTQNPAPEAAQPAVQVGEDSKMEPVKESSPFVNTEPIREDQVQNAMKFLSHPKVRGSPVMYRRSFLERKGLTKEEIDEAFRRVPDPTPSVSTGQQAVTNQDGQQKSSNTQAMIPAQTGQPAPAGTVAKVGTLSHFHWSHALYAVGLLAVSGAGTAVLFKKSIIPRFKSWIRKVVLEEEEEDVSKLSNSKPNLAEEAAAAAKAAAAAAADVARASQEMLISKTEEKRSFEELTKILEFQVREMKSMSNAIQKLEGNTSRNVRAVEPDDYRASAHTSRQYFGSSKADVDTHSARSLSPAASMDAAVPPHPKSYMDIMAMVQRGEKPPNVRDIDDTPPNPNQPLPNPRAAPKPKPWEVGYAQYGSNNGFQSPEVSDKQNGGYQDNQLNGDNSTPWWQQRNVRISEVEAQDEPKIGSSSMLTNERPIQRSWVPPQPPPVAMAEAAAAIRQPKKPVVQKEQLSDDQLLSRSSDVSDELQRVTKISESGGAVEANGGSSGHRISEIQNEENTYMEA